MDEEFEESLRRLEELSLTTDTYRRYELRHDPTILKLVLRAKSGDRFAMHELEARAREFGYLSLLHIVLLLSRETHARPRGLSLEERRNLLQVFDAVLPLIRDIVHSRARAMVDWMTPLLISFDPFDNKHARDVVCSICRCGAVDLEFMTNLVRPNVFSSNDQDKWRAVQILASMALSFGVSPVMPFLKKLCSDTNHGRIREVGYKVVQQVAEADSCAAVPHLSEIVRILTTEMVIEFDTWAVRWAALAISSLAPALNLYGADSFASEMPKILRCMRSHLARNWMVSALACAQASGSVIGLLTEPARSAYAKELMEVVCSDEFVSDTLEKRTLVMKVYKQCIPAKWISDVDVNGWLSNESVFKFFWTKFGELRLSEFSMLIDVAAEIARKIGVAEVMGRAIKGLAEGADHAFMQHVMPFVSEAVATRASSDDVDLKALVFEMRDRCFSP